MNIFEVITQEQVKQLPPEYCTRTSSIVLMNDIPVITNPKRAAMKWDPDFGTWEVMKIASNK